jgi:putative transcriptional regulator
VAITQHAADLAKLSEGPPASMRLVLGYAGWSAGQLVDELERHDWIVVPPDPDLVFGREALVTWRKALASVGIDAETLPQWTASAAGTAAN